MNKENRNIIGGRQIEINGSVLLLIGPIGTFFSRLSKFLKSKNINTYKILFPYKEYGFKKNQIIKFNEEMNSFKLFLLKVIEEKKIRHIFMYGDVIIPHQIAIETCIALRKKGYEIDTEIFELGYLRPNYVTLEKNGVNFKSNIPRDKKFYEKLEKVKVIPKAKYNIGLRVRKLWKGITFIHHAFTNYQITEYDHKLQPKPIYLYYQLLGFIRKYIYMIEEYKIKKNIGKRKNFFLVVLQVSKDSQIVEGSDFNNIENFIKYVIASFKKANIKDCQLVIKHHPRDRGYNNYKKLINTEIKNNQLKERIIYIHDLKIASLLRNKKCKGSIMINSSVGIQSLFHNVPVKVFGKAIYDIDGLTDKKNLEEFLQKPSPPNQELFKKYFNYILQTTQINGNFDGYFPFDHVFNIVN
ncbi:MAG: hypothetical protein CMK49_03785 [Prochlorococcus sp. SP3034]|nr:hypothetical protein [Prochlorococcus sp. SP3034]